MNNNVTCIDLTAEIIAAYVSNNTIAVSELPTLIREVYSAVFAAASEAENEPVEELIPAVSIRRSITPDFLICLEDGKKFKSLKRHLWTHYQITPDQYREKWGLAHDYPMVAPNYAQARSALAREMGLGQKPGSGRRKKR